MTAPTFTAKWAQDQLVRLPRASTALENSALYKYGRDQYNYVFNYGFAPMGNNTPEYNFNAQVDVSSDFWITQIVYAAVTDGTVTEDFAPGYLTLTDNVRQYQICKNVWVGAFAQTDALGDNNYAQRTIWPEPYGIGAGGSFNVQITGVAKVTGPLNSANCQIYIEGFKNYRLGPNVAG